MSVGETESLIRSLCRLIVFVGRGGNRESKKAINRRHGAVVLMAGSLALRGGLRFLAVGVTWQVLLVWRQRIMY